MTCVLENIIIIKLGNDSESPHSVCNFQSNMLQNNTVHTVNYTFSFRRNTVQIFTNNSYSFSQLNGNVPRLNNYLRFILCKSIINISNLQIYSKTFRKKKYFGIQHK